MEWMKGISLGATICINDSLLHMLKNMKRFQPVGMLMVPLMVETIYKKLKDVNPLLPKKLVAKEAFGGKLEYIFCGGAYLDPMYVTEFKKYGIDILQGYGMTECSPVICSNNHRYNRPGSVGKLLDNCAVRFVDEEIQIKGTSVMSGYYDMPTTSPSSPLTAKPWATTNITSRCCGSSPCWTNRKSRPCVSAAKHGMK